MTAQDDLNRQIRAYAALHGYKTVERSGKAVLPASGGGGWWTKDEFGWAFYDDLGALLWHNGENSALLLMEGGDGLPRWATVRRVKG